ncbi:glyoxylate/hydroxypyruvate reductase A [Fulvimarina endophytica]|uniref:Glyoxylate/hydroxypyruvate reductase A n=1 Tax=Fulvimarina endophytica TaxID=2293836 RepID=A0A371X3G8_9HYPH|nr:glyoxylate/hydroxypyruvate reductase A [Fulvimarina endophytica]RFC63778.1 glyoxylate/hydroxypyruvate reductase A [Fulvimarina endophytica]
MSIVPLVATMDGAESEAWRTALQSALPEHRICDPRSLSAAEAASVEVAIVANPDPADLARFPALKWVQSLWAGVERLLTALPAEIGIVRLVDPVLAEAMAEAVLGHVFYLHRRMPDYLEQQRAGIWRPLDQPSAGERTVAVLGLGELGRLSALALSAAGFRVVGWSRTPRRIDGVETFAGDASLEAVIGAAGIVVVVLPLTSQTSGLLDARMLGSLAEGTSLINVGRGPIIETGALLSALDSGRVAHAVLDVFDEEPLPPDHPFWTHRAVTVMPHVAAPTDMRSASAIAARNLRTYFNRGEIPGPVDRAAGY